MKEGIRGIFLHGFMSFAAVCVTVACLLIVGSFSILTYNVNLMVKDLNKTNELLVYIDSEKSDAEAKSVGTKINMIENVLLAKYVSLKITQAQPSQECCARLRFKPYPIGLAKRKITWVYRIGNKSVYLSLYYI